MFVKPVEGVLVRDPVTLMHLPAEGKEVPENTYWLRRIEAGDVVCTTNSKIQKAANKVANRRTQQQPTKPEQEA